MAKNKRSNRNRSKKRMPDATESNPVESKTAEPDALQPEETQSAPLANSQDVTPMLSRNVKLGLSLVIIVHLLAVVLPPLAFQTNGQLGQSSAVATALRPLAAYAQALYLDRGYAFFAPDPGPSHLFQAAITQPGGQIAETLFPDKEQQWPRLNYHRHFMLSEFLSEVYWPPGPPADLVRSDPEAAKEWVRLRRRYEDVRQSVVDHLRAVNNDAPVAIRRIEHVIPNHIEFQELNVDLSDPRLYMVMSDTALDAPPETVPAPPATEELKAPEQGNTSEEGGDTGSSPVGGTTNGWNTGDSGPDALGNDMSQADPEESPGDVSSDESSPAKSDDPEENESEDAATEEASP